eukprot:scaffold142957_cov30-Tisochrysis_lutea.AAC.1
MPAPLVGALVGALALAPRACCSGRGGRTIGRAVRMLSDDADYDLAASEFDLLEGRSFRREAVLRYALEYRTEQLRILFFLSSSILAAAAPWIVGDLFPPALELIPSAAADAAEAPGGVLGQYAAAFGGAAFFSALTVQEKGRRGAKLRRFEKEFALGDLSIAQEAAVGGSLSSARVASLRDRRRVVALCGPPPKLEALLQDAAVYRRRLAQSGVVLVAVPVAGDALPPIAAAAEAEGWLWRPGNARAWYGYFCDLLSDRADGRSADGGPAVSVLSSEGAWLATSLKGRSVGSGVGALPWDELLGTKLPPMAPCAADEPSIARTPAESAVLAAQAALYEHVANADWEAVARACAASDDEEVSAIAKVGRLDNWEVVLKDGVTRGIRLASADALVSPDGKVAWSTGIEHPGPEQAKGWRDGTLLCTQRWLNEAEEGASEPCWRLAQHRTIPYAESMDAAACLRCDRRGCVALQRLR